MLIYSFFLIRAGIGIDLFYQGALTKHRIISYLAFEWLA